MTEKKAELRIGRWVQIYLAVLSGVGSESIDVETRFDDFEIDSVDAVEMAAEFEKAFGVDVGPEYFLRGERTVREMVEDLASRATA